jgi:hypothetical protein
VPTVLFVHRDVGGLSDSPVTMEEHRPVSGGIGSVVALGVLGALVGEGVLLAQLGC